MSPIERYANEIPVELKKGINGLDHKVRQAILVLLIHNHSLSFTELAKLLGLSKGALSHHLGKLQNSALVRNYSKSDFVGPYDSYYSLSKFGESLVDSLTRSVQPSSPKSIVYTPPIYLQGTLANPWLHAEQVDVSGLTNQMLRHYSKVTAFFQAYPETGLSVLQQEGVKHWIVLRPQDYQGSFGDFLKESESISPTQVPLAVAPDQRTAAATR